MKLHGFILGLLMLIAMAMSGCETEEMRLLREQVQLQQQEINALREQASTLQTILIVLVVKDILLLGTYLYFQVFRRLEIRVKPTSPAREYPS